MRQKVRCYTCGAPAPPNSIWLSFEVEEERVNAEMSFECQRCGAPHLFEIRGLRSYSTFPEGYVIVDADEMILTDHVPPVNWMRERREKQSI